MAIVRQFNVTQADSSQVKPRSNPHPLALCEFDLTLRAKSGPSTQAVKQPESFYGV
jgi:hypothetical protein